jgi:hypothetical protein
MEFVEGKIVEISGSGINSMRVKMIRKSRKTSNITVEATENHPPYVQGERLHVQAWELREVTKRPAELARDYEGAVASARRRLEFLVEQGEKARAEIVAKITRGGFEALTYEVAWGHGVKEDITMGLAVQVLDNVETFGMVDALVRAQQYCEQSLLTNRHTGQSSNDFSNAVDATRRECLTRFANLCGDAIAWINDARAEMEVL